MIAYQLRIQIPQRVHCYIFWLKVCLYGCNTNSPFLPSTNEFCEDYVFTGVCLSTGGVCLWSRGVFATHLPWAGTSLGRHLTLLGRHSLADTGMHSCIKFDFSVNWTSCFHLFWFWWICKSHLSGYFGCSCLTFLWIFARATIDVTKESPL